MQPWKISEPKKTKLSSVWKKPKINILKSNQIGINFFFHLVMNYKERVNIHYQWCAYWSFEERSRYSRQFSNSQEIDGFENDWK